MPFGARKSVIQNNFGRIRVEIQKIQKSSSQVGKLIQYRPSQIIISNEFPAQSKVLTNAHHARRKVWTRNLMIEVLMTEVYVNPLCAPTSRYFKTKVISQSSNLKNEQQRIQSETSEDITPTVAYPTLECRSYRIQTLKVTRTRSVLATLLHR